MDIDKPTLQDELDKIRAVCEGNGLVFNLEYVRGDDVGARIRIAKVKAGNRRDYMQMIISGADQKQNANIIDEECVCEINWNGVGWERQYTQTILAKPSVMSSLISDLDKAVG